MATTTGYAAIAMYGEGYSRIRLPMASLHCLLASQDAEDAGGEGERDRRLARRARSRRPALGARVLALYGIRRSRAT
jgi:hypothetical protein